MPRSAPSSTRPTRRRGSQPRDIDTGVVILTGEALRRENAQAIVAVLAREGGDLVCATAGHHMEAMLAAYGSGAARVSHENGHSASSISTSAAAPPSWRWSRTAASPPPRRCMSAAGCRWSTTSGASPGSIRPGTTTPPKPASTGTAAIPSPTQAWTRSPKAWPTRWSRRSCVTPLPREVGAALSHRPARAELGRIDGIMFSGGVGEFVYRREARDFGDMGRRLGHAHAPAHRCRRAALAAAAGRRMHPRHGAWRFGL